MRYGLQLSYAGTNYVGWQRQPNGVGVQQVLEEALQTLLRLPIEVVAAGRTDAGVHARMQVVHFELPETNEHGQILSDLIVDHKFVFKLNSVLPRAIAIQCVWRAADDFHARYKAVYRAYQYHLHQHKSPFLDHASWFMPRPLDFTLMNQAASMLLKHTDFECFSKVHTEVNNFRCTISLAQWRPDSPREGSYVFDIKANRFLRGMVRAVVGTLVEVGLHKMTLDEFGQVLTSNDRGLAGSAAPPYGLYLTDIGY